jgi:hypothetical protein
MLDPQPQAQPVPPKPGTPSRVMTRKPRGFRLTALRLGTSVLDDDRKSLVW